MDPGHKARKNPSDNADLGFQAVGSALRIMQLNVEGLSAATTVVSAEPFSHGTGTLRCLQKEMATYRH